MLSISDIKLGSVVKINNQPYTVTWTQHVQMGRGGAILRTKVKNLIDGSVLEKTFKGADKIEEADLERAKASFLYSDEDNVYFMDSQSYEQFSLPKDQIGEKINFLKEGTDVDVLNFEEKPVSMDLPTKVALKVTETAPGVRGDTAQGGATKAATLETGYVLQVPLFINQDDEVRVNTDTGEYVERV